jgi:hypothetical protein
MSKHTPGPWTITEVENEPCNGDGYWVAWLDLGPKREEASWPDATASVHPCLGLSGQPISKEAIEANARLIAAAPDLLSALERAESLIASLCEEYRGHLPDLVAVRAAIKKARGDV